MVEKSGTEVRKGEVKESQEDWKGQEGWKVDGLKS
jgi:hypothetical protein